MVRFIDVYKEYDNGTKAINGVTFTINDGEMVFLVGPSGSGSRLLSALSTRKKTDIGKADGQRLQFQHDGPSDIPFMRRTLGVIFKISA